MLDDGAASLGRRMVDPPALRRAHHLRMHLPYVAHVADDAMMLRDGDVMASILVDGIAADTADPGQVSDLSAALARVVAQAGPDVGFYMHRVSTPARPELAPVRQGSAFAQEVDARWRARLGQGLRRRRTMLSVLIRPARLRGFWARFGGGGEARLREDMRRRVARLDEVVDTLEAAVAPARPTRLRKDDGRWLGLLRAAVSGRCHPVTPGLGFAPLADAVAYSRVDFGDDGFVVLGSDVEDMRFGAIFGLKRYPSWTEPGLLDRLNLDLDTVVTHSFTPVDQLTALERVRRTARQMSSSDDAAVSLRVQLEEAADDLASGRIGFGAHHATVAVFAQNPEELEQACARVRSAAQGAGLDLVREHMGARAAWFAQHPGNAAYRPRKSMISTRNFADLVALHGTPPGAPAERAPWGEAITVLPTIGREPYRFNFHLPATGAELPLGHTLVVGRTGSGKSVSTAFLMAQAERVAPRMIVFDKDGGLEMAVRALGGDYADVRMGEPTGFNPFAAEADARGAAWLTDWIAGALMGEGAELTPVQGQALARAARANADADPGLRTLSSFRTQLRAVDDGGGLHERLGEWDAEGRYGWLFSGTGPDQLRLDRRIMAFDLTEILDAPRARTAWLAYVFRRIERLVEDGRPTLIVLDEAWRLLDDPYFQSRLKDWMLTMRKKNVVVALLTQRVAHITESAAGGAILESAATTILFPNSRASAAELAPLALTEAETGFLLEPGDGHRLALVRSGDASVILDMDLSALGGLVDVLGGGRGVKAPQGWRERDDFWRELER